jgi:hypothetical protein
MFDSPPQPLEDFKPLSHRGNTIDRNGNEMYGCHRGSEGYLNIINPKPGMVYYWGNAKDVEYKYPSMGWELARGVKAGRAVGGGQARTPTDGSIRAPGGSILLEMPEELAAERRNEHTRRNLAEIQNDGRQAFLQDGLSIQERAAYYTNNRNPYEVLPIHGISYTEG